MDDELRKQRISEWLTATRARHVREDDGKRWSQGDFVSEVQRRIGWKLHRENYSGWERGATNPEPETLEKLIEFWALYDEPGPDLSEPPESEPVRQVSLGDLLDRIDRQSTAIERLADQVVAEREERLRWERGWITTLRAALVGQVPTELLDALVPPPPGDALT